MGLHDWYNGHIFKEELKFNADVMNFYETMVGDNTVLAEIAPFNEENWPWYNDIKLYKSIGSALFAEYAKCYVEYNAESIKTSLCYDIFKSYLLSKYQEWREKNGNVRSTEG